MAAPPKPVLTSLPRKTLPKLYNQTQLYNKAPRRQLQAKKPQNNKVHHQALAPETALAQPVTALAQPVTALAQPVTALAQPVTAKPEKSTSDKAFEMLGQPGFREFLIQSEPLSPEDMWVLTNLAWQCGLDWISVGSDIDAANKYHSKKSVLYVLCAHHPRCGKHSTLLILPHYVLIAIIKLAFADLFRNTSD